LASAVEQYPEAVPGQLLDRACGRFPSISGCA
jgi:hypothetical protein